MSRYESIGLQWARDVRVKNVPDPKIERPTDVLVKITSTNICGSDLHMYEGRTDMEKGRVLGHENLGQVVEVAKPWIGLRWRTGFVCLSMSPAAFVKIVRRGLTGFVLLPILERLARYGFAGWDLTAAAKPNTFACPMATSIVETP